MPRLATALMIAALPAVLSATLSATLPAALSAQEADPGAAKFRLSGATLVYDTETTVDGEEAEITNGDIDRLLTLLRANPDINALELNSSGGSVYAGDEIARIVIDFGLDTVVSGVCSSSCVNIFLAGKARRMMLGSKIGFHQRHWPVDAMESYYNRWADEKRWETPFDFASWVYQDTQSEMYQDLKFMVERGVDPAFAIETKKVLTSDEWFPSRQELTEAGVLRE